MRFLLTLPLLAACPTPPTDIDPEPPTETVDADQDGFDSKVDCDDSDAEVHPGADERCNGYDDDCDGEIDENAVDSIDAHIDADGDGFGDPTTAVPVCELADDQIEDNTDCDDTDPAIHPDALELCDPDNVDEDCDGAADDDDLSAWEATKTRWFADTDNDGFGDRGNSKLACDPSPGWTVDNTDCDDTDAGRNPVDGCPGPWEGRWDGRLEIDARTRDGSITDPCTTTGPLLINEALTPQLDTDGSWTCGGLYITGPISITGSFVGPSTIDGTFTVQSETFPFSATLSDSDGLYATGSAVRTVFGYTVDIDYTLSATKDR